jgi:hypothetical protein
LFSDDGADAAGGSGLVAWGTDGAGSDLDDPDSPPALSRGGLAPIEPDLSSRDDSLAGLAVSPEAAPAGALFPLFEASSLAASPWVA